MTRSDYQPRNGFPSHHAHKWVSLPPPRNQTPRVGFLPTTPTHGRVGFPPTTTFFNRGSKLELPLSKSLRKSERRLTTSAPAGNGIRGRKQAREEVWACPMKIPRSSVPLSGWWISRCRSGIPTFLSPVCGNRRQAGTTTGVENSIAEVQNFPTKQEFVVVERGIFEFVEKTPLV